MKYFCLALVAIVLLSGGEYHIQISDFTEGCLTVVAVAAIICFTWFKLQTQDKPEKGPSLKFPSDCRVEASGSLVDEVIKKRYELHQACLNFRHDFELLNDDEQAQIKNEAEQWAEAWEKVK